MGGFLTYQHYRETHLSRYEQVRFLGRGGFGAAYLFKDTHARSLCVLKIVDLSPATGKAEIDAKKEVDVLKSISHPNIVKYLNSFKEGSNLYIVTEYCEGGDLMGKVRAQTSPFPEDQVWTWLVEICFALKYLHGRKIIHRDLKPANIFLTMDNSIRLGDFGLAKVLIIAAGYAETGVGTFHYISPEMVQGRPHNHKIDAWSLGVTLYQLLTLKVPFKANNAAAICMMIQDMPHAPITGYSQEMAAVVDQLLIKEPRQRPSVTDVLEFPGMKEHATAEERLRNVYRFIINDKGELFDLNGKRYCSIHESNTDNNLRYEGIANALEEYLYQQMEIMQLKKLPVPVHASIRQDFDNSGTVIFASENWNTCQRLIVLIHGSGKVRAGQWTRRLMINNSMDEGTQLPYIRHALDRGYGVVVLNTNDNKPGVEGCQNSIKHGLYVWQHYISKAEATHIAVKAHSQGGQVAREMMSEFTEDFKRRVFANAFTGANASNYSKSLVSYARKVTRNWVSSNMPIGTKVLIGGCDVECVSAGTPNHIETPYKAFQQVFEFIENKFQDRSPGNP